MNRFALAFVFAAGLMLGTMGPDPARAAGSCSVVPGLWAWFANGDVTFRSNGSLVQGQLTGTWRCANGRVTIDWSHGYRDTLTIAQDGRSMSGVNQQGNQVWGSRRGGGGGGGHAETQPCDELFGQKLAPDHPMNMCGK